MASAGTGRDDADAAARAAASVATEPAHDLLTYYRSRMLDLQDERADTEVRPSQRRRARARRWRGARAAGRDL